MDINTSDETKTLWIVNLDFFTGEILDVKEMIVKKYVVIGNTGNRNNIVDVSLTPSKIECKECGNDKKKIIEAIKNSITHQKRILGAIYPTTLKFNH